MRILFLQDDFPPHAKGGAGIVVGSLAKALKERGHDIAVITAVQDRALAGSFRENGLRVERVYSDYAPRWRAWRSLYNPPVVRVVSRLLSEIKPDVVHAHNVHYHLSYWSLMLARKSGAKVFLTAHDAMLFHYGKFSGFTDSKDVNCEQKWNYKVSQWQQCREYRFWYNPLRNIFIKHALKNVEQLFAVSEALKDALEQNGIYGAEVLYNGIDEKVWRASEASIVEFKEIHVLEGKKLIFFGGRISPAKGAGVMIDILELVVRSVPKATLVIVGKETAYVESLIAKAHGREIGEHVLCTGWLAGEALRAAYRIADVFVVPSLYLDPLPTVALEAMICSKPVVGSCLGGIPEIIEDGKAGYLAHPLDTEAFAGAVIRLLSDEKLRAEMGRAAYERVITLFSLEQHLETLTRAYASSLCAQG